MTKEEAVKKARQYGYGEGIVDLMEALELITFEDEKSLDHMTAVAFQQYKTLNRDQRQCLKNAIFIFDGE